jgi:Sulfotransferase domain
VDIDMASASRYPDFIIGGAPRCGTTFLCHALSRHPRVHMVQPFIPEPKVFFGAEQSADTYRDRYARMFAAAGADQVLGEKTSNYLESELACERILRYLPMVRLVFIFREPVARAYSNYLWSTKNGLETMSFEEAVELEGRRASPLPPEKSHARPFDYLCRGDYATFSERYIRGLGRDNVAFFLYEDIERQPDTMMDRLQRFLGVEPMPFADLDVGVVNSASDVGPELCPGTRARLKERMAPHVARFAKLSELDLSAWEY